MKQAIIQADFDFKFFMKVVCQTRELFETNLETIAMTENRIIGGRNVNIDVRYHFIRELVEAFLTKYRDFLMRLS